MAASDLVGPTFHPCGAYWHQSKRALSSEVKDPKFRTACQARQLEGVELRVASIRNGGGHFAPAALGKIWWPLTRDGCRAL